MKQDFQFDYIIVGAGAAGSVLAHRLSESPQTRVALIEAGPGSPSKPEALRLPSLMLALDPSMADHFWPGLEASRTANQGVHPMLRGKGVGGSTRVNGAIVLRGLPEDYDHWEALGCRGWGSDAFMRTFASMENGLFPVKPCSMPTWSRLSLALCDAALSAGHPWCPDPHAPRGEGVSPLLMNVRRGHKISADEAWLDPIRHRSNLELITHAIVDRVCFDRQDATKVAGVEVVQEGERRCISAPQVILSAGAVHSPAILQRSGIGDARQLAKLGIEIHQDLPGVGRNLLDHPLIALELELASGYLAPHPHVRWADCCVRFQSAVAGSECNDLLIMNANVLPPSWGGPHLERYRSTSIRPFQGAKCTFVPTAFTTTL